MERNNPTGILDPRSKLAVFVTACFSVFSGLSYIQEISLLALCVFTTLLCRKWKRAFYTSVLFLAMLLSDLYMVPHLTGVSRNIMTAICHVLRFILPLFASFYLITKTTKIGEYISALTKMHMPSEVVIPLAVMFRFVPTIQEKWQMVNQALRLRGLAWNWRNVLTRPVHMLEYMMVPFLMQCSVVVDEMSAAVMARGFDRDTRRSSYIEVKLSILDWCIITVSAGILAWNLIV